MPPIFSRIVFAAVLCLLLTPSISSGQSGPDSGQASSSHTISFSYGDYDVISSIYVFLTSNNQQPVCAIKISSIERSGGIFPPPPISLSLLYQEALNHHYDLGHIPCEDVDEITLDASLTGTGGILGIVFNLLSVLHLLDHWIYDVDVECDDNPIISFLRYEDESILD